MEKGRGTRKDVSFDQGHLEKKNQGQDARSYSRLEKGRGSGGERVNRVD